MTEKTTAEVMADDYEENLDDLKGSVTNSHVSRWSTDWTTETIASQIRKGNIDLYPSFQRREAWPRAKQSRFIESLILGLPVPQIILAERNDGSGQFIVIDGKQRLLSLSNFYGLRRDQGIKPLRLTGLTGRDYDKKTYDELSNDAFHRRIITQFENQPIRTVIIGNWKDDNYLYEVFLRINTSGTPLSPQELRQALHPGKFSDFLDKTSAESVGLKNILKIKDPDFRMRDVELLLRYYAYRNHNQSYRGNLKLFLDETAKIYNDQFEEKFDQIIKDAQSFEVSANITEKVFGTDNMMRKWTENRYENAPNRAVFDIMTYYFSIEEYSKIFLDQSEQIVDTFKDLCTNNPEFRTSIESTTKSIDANKARFGIWSRKLSEIIGKQLESPFENHARMNL